MTSPTAYMIEDDPFLACHETFDHEEDKQMNSDQMSYFAVTQQIALEEMDLQASYRSMLRQELNRPDFSTKYEYLKYRRVLVDWVSEVGEEMQIRKGTIHTAIAYLERLLCKNGALPPKDQFQLLALTCIQIASKYLGPEDEVPPLGEFWEYGNRCYRMEEFYSCEISTLTELNWNLTSLAPIHFMEFYLSQQVIFENDKIHGTEIVDEVIEYYSKYAEFFVDLCMQEYSFQEFRPSQIAASILATSRKVLGMSPLWREELETLTGYTEEQVEPCFSVIWSHYMATFSKNSEKEVSPSSVTAIV